MRRRMILAGGVVGVCLCLAPPATAGEYCVDAKHAAADDAGAGTKDRPWKTVGKAAGALGPGDTVVVMPGIYRERVAPKRSGTAERPVTYRAAGKGVVLSGADALTGWARCTRETCPNNPHHGRIWHVDVDWRPGRLFVDGKAMTRARQPNAGWWIARGGGTHTLIDAANLAQPGGYWLGATVFFWDVDMTTQGWRNVVGFNAATHTLKLDKPIYRDRVVQPGRDRYFVENKLALLDRPGEWAVEARGKRHRVYLWPPAGADPAGRLVEAPRRGRFVFEYGNRRHLRIEGFEVSHGAGHGIGSWTATARDVRITRCHIHHNQGCGLYVRSAEDVVLRGNLVRRNGNGVTAGTVRRIRIEGNEIADNAFDGLVVSHASRDVTIRRNYIHGHTRWGHPDNVQFHNGVTNVVIEENVLLDGGQSLMMEQCTDGVLRGNLIVGAEAYAVICGHRNVHRFQFIGNTIALTGYAAIAFSGTDYELRNNVLCPGGSGGVFSVADGKGFRSDRNLLFKPAGAAGCFAAYARNWPRGLAGYRKVSGQDAHSISADPQFVNAPALCVQIDNRRLSECTPARLLVRGWDGAFAPGDHVEVKFDGVVRMVKSAAAGHVVVDPPLPAAPEKAGLVLNWKDKTDYTLDLRLKPGSPARGTGAGGADLGARLDLRAFARGDTDGNGKVDVRRP